MKIKDGFVLREVGGQTVAIATGEASKTFHGMIKLNRTSGDIWRGIADGLTKEQIAEKLTADYQVDRETALSDVQMILDKMTEAGLLIL